MIPDEEITALYKYFDDCFYNKIEPTVEDVKGFIERSSLSIFEKHNWYGHYPYQTSPLLFALNIRAPPDVIQLLVDKGGIDWEYKAYEVYHISKFVDECIKTSCDNYPECGHIFKAREDAVVIYSSIKNSLVMMYHYLHGSVKLINQCLTAQTISYRTRHKLPLLDQHLLPYFDEVTEKDPIPDNAAKHIEYLKQFCTILSVDYNSLENERLDLPEDVSDFTKLPEDSESSEELE